MGLLLTNLDRVAKAAAEHGIRAVLHPHVGTMVESGADVTRVLERAQTSSSGAPTRPS